MAKKHGASGARVILREEKRAKSDKTRGKNNKIKIMRKQKGSIENKKAGKKAEN